MRAKRAKKSANQNRKTRRVNTRHQTRIEEEKLEHVTSSSRGMNLCGRNPKLILC